MHSKMHWVSSQTIEKWFPEVKAQLDKITNDINKGIEKIQKRELILSQQFEIWV